MASKTKTATKKVAAKPAAKAVAISLKQIGATLAEKYELPKKQANEIADNLFEIIAKELKRGTKIRVPGFGIFVVAKRAARMGRNPATGEAIQIKASKKVRFRPAKELKESI
jgi:DNA-binding protein HU-beta